VVISKIAITTLHTLKICRTLDKKHFPVKDYQAGVTAPPFHVYCRSTTAPYFDDEFDVPGERAARDKDGNTYYIPADMNYREWEKTFVKDSSGSVDKSGGSGIIREETNHAVYKKFSTGEEVNKFFYYDSDNHSILAKKKSQYSQWVKNLSDETKDVIDNYSTDGYDDINRYWRKIGDWENINKDKVLYQTEKLDNAIASFELKDNLKVYRGVDLGTIANMFPDAEELTDLRGKIYSDKAFSSTSPISDVAKRFVEQNGQDGIMLELDIPSGAGKGAYLDALSAFGESIVGSAQAEYEFLLKRGAKFEIYDIDETNSFPILKGRWVE
jgi:hypothetical protein